MQAITELAIQIGLFYLFILIGYVISRLIARSAELNKYLNSLLINILIPALVIYTLVSADPSAYSEVSTVILLAVVIHLAAPALMYIRTRFGEFDDPTKGVFYICVTFNNALFIPLPFAVIFLGSSGVSLVILFSLTQMLLFVTLGSLMGAIYSEKNTGWKRIARNAATFPPFLAALLAIFLFSISFEIPEMVSYPLSFAGPITTYLALISVGLNVGMRFTLVDVKSALNVIGIRQVAVPLLIIPLVLLSGLSHIPASIVILESLMPPAVLTVVYATSFGLDAEKAATIVTVGTLLLLPLVPFLPMLLG
jgi:predicted permease